MRIQNSLYPASVQHARPNLAPQTVVVGRGDEPDAAVRRRPGQLPPVVAGREASRYPVPGHQLGGGADPEYLVSADTDVMAAYPRYLLPLFSYRERGRNVGAPSRNYT